MKDKCQDQSLNVTDWQKHFDGGLSSYHPRKGQTINVVVLQSQLDWVNKTGYKKDGFRFVTETPDVKTNVWEFWKNPLSAPPEQFLRPELAHRSYLAYNMVREITDDKSAVIMELGCGAGRNLGYLYDRGYDHLWGVDICIEAIEKLKADHKYIATNTCSVEDWANVTRTFPAYDIILGFAFFEHIHTDSEWVFKKIAESTKYVISISNEQDLGCVHFPRNYQKVFEGVGMKQIFEMPCPQVEPGFIGRIFENEM